MSSTFPGIVDPARGVGNLSFDDKGLIPAIVQDFETNRVLMLGYMNAASIERTFATGRVTFFIGKDGKVLHVEKKVKTKDHGKQIIDKLKELKVEPAPKDEKKKK